MSNSLASATKERDLFIRPKIAWFDLHVTDLSAYRVLPALFVWRHLVAYYNPTILGPLWYCLQPPRAALTFLLLLLMAGLGLGAVIIVSALTTRYRDLQQLVAFGVQLMMYATPVVYPLSMIGGGSFRWLILANPMTPIVETFRYAYLGSGTLDGMYLCYTAGFTLAVLFIGVVLFNHVERTFMDTV